LTIRRKGISQSPRAAVVTPKLFLPLSVYLLLPQALCHLPQKAERQNFDGAKVQNPMQN
jgi:hypothetical protein